MAEIGYTMMCKQRSPKDIVDRPRLRRAGGVRLLGDQRCYTTPGWRSRATRVVGARGGGERYRAHPAYDLMTYITYPIIHYHPAIVAQEAATMGLSCSTGGFRWVYSALQ